MSRRYDKVFLWIVATLIATGFLIFASASLGFLSRGNVSFSTILIKQFLFVVFFGGGLFLVTFFLDYRIWKKFAVWIFLFSFLLTILVFVPGIGSKYGGATRWINIGPVSFQPSEFLKLGFIIYLAAWLSSHKKEIKTLKSGLLPFIVMFGFVAFLLASEPDFGTIFVIIVASLSVFFIAGARYRDIFIFIFMGFLVFSLFVFAKPYLKSRIMVFLDPNLDTQGASYQINQSLIAIGSGGAFGRGFGMSVQKFKYLPEPVGDSIFSVWAEEKGFLGSIFLIGLFLAFFYRGFTIAAHAPNTFGLLLASGIVVLIIGQSFLNIASMVGFLPLTGLPLIFASQGVSAYAFAMAEVGILLNISKHT